MFEYDEVSRKVAETFDQYDLTEFLSDCFNRGMDDLYDIRDELEHEAPELYAIAWDFTDDEFMLYLSIRYNVTFYEVSTYKMRYVNK